MESSGVFDLLKELKSDVDRYIFDFLPSGHDIPEIDLLYQMMRDYPSRAGKGLRPGLLLIFNRAYGGNDAQALNTAAALELFQNWIVIHDDIEDQSDLRRGLPALHIKHGVALALNAGDALAGKMWEMLLKNSEILGGEKTIAILDEFLKMYDHTTAGQHIELGWVNAGRWDITEDDYFNMCRRKTAWYTVITPSWVGAYIAGANPAARDIIVQFGMDLGVAFQIQDDILNLAGDIGKYGKEIAGDL
jgi:geranylgeranyl diphosphate synthase type II